MLGKSVRVAFIPLQVLFLVLRANKINRHGYFESKEFI